MEIETTMNEINNNFTINIKNENEEKIIKIVIDHLFEKIIKPAIQECNIDEESKKIVLESIFEKNRKLKEERTK